MHLDGSVQDALKSTHGLEYLERTRLHPNRFGILRRFQEWIDDKAVDTAPGQLDGRGEADGAGTGDEYLRLRGVGHALIMLPP